MSSSAQQVLSPDAESAPATVRSYVCPLCGQAFTEDQKGCHDGCPLNRHCGVICCCYCGYEFVDTTNVERRFSRIGAWLRRLSRGRH